MSAPVVDAYGNPPETGAERLARVERRRKAGLCQRSRYCRRPARRPGARYCPACRVRERAALLLDSGAVASPRPGGPR